MILPHTYTFEHQSKDERDNQRHYDDKRDHADEPAPVAAAAAVPSVAGRLLVHVGVDVTVEHSRRRMTVRRTGHLDVRNLILLRSKVNAVELQNQTK